MERYFALSTAALTCRKKKDGGSSHDTNSGGSGGSNEGASCGLGLGGTGKLLYLLPLNTFKNITRKDSENQNTDCDPFLEIETEVKTIRIRHNDMNGNTFFILQTDMVQR